MPPRSIHDLVHLRWRTAQLLRAITIGDERQAATLRQAMRIEKLDTKDVREETALLRRQFGYRAPARLAEEINRQWRLLVSLCVRCGRRSRHLDNDHICAECIIKEGDG